jgi:uncharacterized membrane protein YbaN (DUF454 family)
MRLAYRIAGLVAVALGLIGILLPLLPTVPFMLLAAFCFARGNPAWEARLLAHPRYGPHIRAWRREGAISRKGKRLAILTFTLSGLAGLLLLEWPLALLPGLVGLVGSGWILTRPDPRLGPEEGGPA